MRIRRVFFATILIGLMTVSSFASVTVTKSWDDNLTGTNASNRSLPTVNVEGSISYENLLDLMHPVGSYYSTENDSFDPNTAWGGEWEKLATGTTLIQAGENYPINSTGGEAEHALTASEMPPHRHWISGAAYDDGNMSYSGSNSQDFGLAGDAGSYTSYDQAKSNGRYDAYAGGAAGADGRGSNSMSTEAVPHNNMPPYVAVNIWQRIH